MPPPFIGWEYASWLSRNTRADWLLCLSKSNFFVGTILFLVRGL